MSRPPGARGAAHLTPAQYQLGHDEPSDSEPSHYELRLEGHLDEHWSAWFGGLTLTREEDGTTTLRGAVADQAELHGLLAKVRDLGATLISVTPADRRVHTPGGFETASSVGLLNHRNPSTPPAG